MFFPNAEWPVMTCVYPPFLMVSTSNGAKFSGGPYRNSRSAFAQAPFRLGAVEDVPPCHKPSCPPSTPSPNLLPWLPLLQLILDPRGSHVLSLQSFEQL